MLVLEVNVVSSRTPVSFNEREIFRGGFRENWSKVYKMLFTPKADVRNTKSVFFYVVTLFSSVFFIVQVLTRIAYHFVLAPR